jgi:hypothetical protein
VFLIYPSSSFLFFFYPLPSSPPRRRYNNERLRAQHRVRQRTVSVWTDILSHREHFLNPHYSPGGAEASFQCGGGGGAQPPGGGGVRALRLNYSMRYLRLWENYFFRR